MEPTAAETAVAAWLSREGQGRPDTVSGAIQWFQDEKVDEAEWVSELQTLKDKDELESFLTALRQQRETGVKIGSEMVLEGLSSAQYNGQRVAVGAFLADRGRYQVELADNRTLAVMPDKLRPLTDHEVASDGRRTVVTATDRAAAAAEEEMRRRDERGEDMEVEDEDEDEEDPSGITFSTGDADWQASQQRGGAEGGTGGGALEPEPEPVMEAGQRLRYEVRYTLLHPAEAAEAARVGRSAPPLCVAGTVLREAIVGANNGGAILAAGFVHDRWRAGRCGHNWHPQAAGPTNNSTAMAALQKALGMENAAVDVFTAALENAPVAVLVCAVEPLDEGSGDTPQEAGGETAQLVAVRIEASVGDEADTAPLLVFPSAAELEVVYPPSVSHDLLRALPACPPDFDRDQPYDVLNQGILDRGGTGARRLT